jgi:hypothetical protein
MNTDDYLTQLRHKVKELARHGGDLREQTSKLVSDASTTAYAKTEGLRGIANAVAEGAVAGAKQALPDDSDAVLRSIVGGLSDGLIKSAQALRLTLEESTAKGSSFAAEDLTKIGQDFRSLGQIINDTLTGAASALSGHVKDQAKTVADHAKQALHDAWPPVEAALSAAQRDPAKLGNETLQAGTSAVRQAAGVLFQELSNYLQKAGEKLRG